MYQPEDNSNFDSSQKLNLEQNLDNIDANLSAKNVAARKKQIESVFMKLIAFGLAVGAILGVGAYYLLNKLGLTKKPYQIEQEKIEREREQQSKEPFKEISVFPEIPKSITSHVDRI
ncbi:MAG: hypothetical protein QNJ53_27465 [Pleurocapsa sp. MO_192.B19]|nr:hypothetical protein [Pleurocapsa sp. MO_192.B19]